MSVRDNNKVIYLEDGTTGDILLVLDYDAVSNETLKNIVNDYMYKCAFDNEHCFIIRLGFKK